MCFCRRMNKESKLAGQNKTNKLHEALNEGILVV